MNYKIAIDILDIKQDNFTKKELKRAYYKKCLKYHPDKNNSNGEMFKKCKEAYDYLSNNNNLFTDDNNMTYMDFIKNYISLISEKYEWNNELINSIFEIIINDAKKISFKIFENMDKNTLIKIYEYINKFKDLFNIDKTTIIKLREIIKSKYENIKFFNLNPSIDDLIHNMIYVLEYNNKKKYIPLWHNELHFNDCIVYINPELPNNIEIDDDNNINIFIEMTESEMFAGISKKISICENVDVYIDTNNLLCRKFQKYILQGYGISKINDENIFDVSNKSDIIFHIYKT